MKCLKLWPAPWLVSLRHTSLGHLVFGHVFSWSNFPAYAAGILAAFLIETAFARVCADRGRQRNAR